MGVTPARIGSAAAVLRRVVEGSRRRGADRALSEAKITGSDLGQAASQSWPRRWASPARVIEPRRWVRPVEFSPGTRPVKLMKGRALGKRRQSNTSAARHSAPILVTPR